MTPFHALIHEFLQGFNPALAVVLADACDEREIHDLAKELRYWATRENLSLITIYNTGFPSFYGDVENLAKITGVERTQLETYEWLARGSTTPKRKRGTCGQQSRGDSKLELHEHPLYRARIANMNAWKQRSRTGFYRICTKPTDHRGAHVDERDLSQLVPTPLPSNLGTNPVRPEPDEFKKTV